MKLLGAVKSAQKPHRSQQYPNVGTVAVAVRDNVTTYSRRNAENINTCPELMVIFQFYFQKSTNRRIKTKQRHKLNP